MAGHVWAGRVSQQGLGHSRQQAVVCRSSVILLLGSSRWSLTALQAASGGCSPSGGTILCASCNHTLCMYRGLTWCNGGPVLAVHPRHVVYYLYLPMHATNSSYIVHWCGHMLSYHVT